MPNLTIWRFPTAFGVDSAELRLKWLEEQHAIRVHDAVAVIWMPRADKPVVRHLRHRRAAKTGRGALWGAVLGTLVLAPVAGAAVGATAAALTDRLRKGCVDEDTIRSLSTSLTPGTSALVLEASDADPAVVAPVIKALEATLIHAQPIRAIASSTTVMNTPIVIYGHGAWLFAAVASVVTTGFSSTLFIFFSSAMFSPFAITLPYVAYYSLKPPA